jgi:hypothetical protein
MGKFCSVSVLGPNGGRGAGGRGVEEPKHLKPFLYTLDVSLHKGWLHGETVGHSHKVTFPLLELTFSPQHFSAFDNKLNWCCKERPGALQLVSHQVREIGKNVDAKEMPLTRKRKNTELFRNVRVVLITTTGDGATAAVTSFPRSNFALCTNKSFPLV